MNDLFLIKDFNSAPTPIFLGFGSNKIWLGSVEYARLKHFAVSVLNVKSKQIVRRVCDALA